MDPAASTSSSTTSHPHGVAMAKREATDERASRLQTVAPRISREELHARPRVAAAASHEPQRRERQEHTRYRGARLERTSSRDERHSHEHPLRRLQETSSSAMHTPPPLLPNTPGSPRRNIDGGGVWGTSPRHVVLERAGGAPRQVHQWPADITSSRALKSRPKVGDALDRSVRRSDSFASSSSSVSKQDRLLAASNAESATISNNSKTSRYLREMDRRDILHRIRQGEKQSALAKEYNISRSAVCNLNKKRDAVLARKCDNPLAKHPKLNNRRAGSKAVATASTTTHDHSVTHVQAHVAASTAGSMNGYVEVNTVSQQPHEGLHVMKASHCPAALLLSRLQSSKTSENEFRRCADRLMWLVLEEAMALVQLHVVEIDLSQREVSTSSAVTGAGVVASNPTCALSLEQNGCPMLDLFNLLEPDLPTGYVRISCRQDSNKESDPAHFKNMRLSATILQAHLPRDLSQYNVLLLDTVVDSGEAVCCAIEKIVTQLGGAEKRISIVTLFISSEAIAKVVNRYPLVCIVAVDGDFPGDSSNGFAATTEAFSHRIKELV